MGVQFIACRVHMRSDVKGGRPLAIDQSGNVNIRSAQTHGIGGGKINRGSIQGEGGMPNRVSITVMGEGLDVSETKRSYVGQKEFNVNVPDSIRQAFAVRKVGACKSCLGIIIIEYDGAVMKNR